MGGDKPCTFPKYIHHDGTKSLMNMGAGGCQYNPSDGNSVSKGISVTFLL